MIPQTIHMLVYKNAIANKLRIIKKLSIQNIEQFDDMIKHNNNSMNKFFWHLFTQLISQLAQMHKESDIAMTEWEQHFQKLQYGLIFDENHPDVTESSENQNCNKMLIQNDAGSSQDKSYDKYKTHSLDECVKNMVKGLRAVPRHLNINKRKTLDVQPDTQKFPHEIFNTETQSKKIAKTCVCATKNIFGIWMKRISLITAHGKNVTIAKDIMNYI